MIRWRHFGSSKVKEAAQPGLDVAKLGRCNCLDDVITQLGSSPTCPAAKHKAAAAAVAFDEGLPPLCKWAVAYCVAGR